MGLRAAVPFALVGNTEKQNNFFKRMMLTELEEVKHAMFAHDGGMGGNGTWLSPFAFSWRLRAAVPFALCGPVCAQWCYHKFAAKGRTGGCGRDCTSGSNLMVGMALCSLHFCFALPFAFVANHALTRTMLAQGGRAGSKTNHDYTSWWHRWEWHIALSQDVLLLFSQCGFITKLRLTTPIQDTNRYSLCIGQRKMVNSPKFV